MTGPGEEEFPIGASPLSPQITQITPEAGEIVTVGEGLIVHAGPEPEWIRTSDTRGWTSSGDVKGGVVDLPSATGKPSHGEHLSGETSAILVRRLNQDGASWGDPVSLHPITGGGDDYEAKDTRNAGLPRVLAEARFHPLRIQVTRPKIDAFFKDLCEQGEAQMPPGTTEQVVQALWAGIDGKRLAAHPKVVLALNVILTSWLALSQCVDAFRQKFGADARKVGFQEIWVVGPDETFTHRLDV
jgi:hypothetical protein